ANKYILMSLVVLFALWLFAIRSKPLTVEIMSNGTYAYVGSTILDLVHSIEKDHCVKIWGIDLIRQRRCMSIDRVDGAVTDLIVCTLPAGSLRFEERDPLTIMEKLSRHIPCLQLDGIARRRVTLDVDRGKTSEWPGDTHRFCG